MPDRKKLLEAEKARPHGARPVARTATADNPLARSQTGDHAGALRAGGPAAMLSLQRMAGNGAVVGMLQSAAPVGASRSSAPVMAQRAKSKRSTNGWSDHGVPGLQELLRAGYLQGRYGLNVKQKAPGRRAERGGLGKLLKAVGKGVVTHPGRAIATSHRSAALFGGMAAGMVGGATMWAPEKFGWTRPKADRSDVNFRGDEPGRGKRGGTSTDTDSDTDSHSYAGADQDDTDFFGTEPADTDFDDADLDEDDMDSAINF